MDKTGASTRALPRSLAQLSVIAGFIRRLLYMYYIHPELRIGNCRFRSEKGARGSKNEQGGAAREQRGSKEKAPGESIGSKGRVRLEPLLAPPGYSNGAIKGA